MNEKGSLILAVKKVAMVKRPLMVVITLLIVAKIVLRQSHFLARPAYYAIKSGLLIS
jgi:hypothetical protein